MFIRLAKLTVDNPACPLISQMKVGATTRREMPDMYYQFTIQRHRYEKDRIQLCSRSLHAFHHNGFRIAGKSRKYDRGNR